MDAREKIDAAVAALRARNIDAATAVPPLWKLCWRFGLMVPPPHFLGFIPLVVLTGLPFGVVMAAVGGVAVLVAGRAPDDFVALLLSGSAAFFGVSLATYYRWSAWRLGLPSWSRFRAGLDDEDADW